MNICYYCQDNIDPKEEFLIVQPDKSEIHVCSECMGDIIKFFKSGEIEDKKIAELAPPKCESQDAMLGVDMRQRALCQTDGEGKVIRAFRNIELKNLQVKPTNHPYQWYQNMYAYNGSGPFSNLPKPTQFIREIEINGIIFDTNGKAILY